METDRFNAADNLAAAFLRLGSDNDVFDAESEAPHLQLGVEHPREGRQQLARIFPAVEFVESVDKPVRRGSVMHLIQHSAQQFTFEFNIDHCYLN